MPVEDNYIPRFLLSLWKYVTSMMKQILFTFLALAASCFNGFAADYRVSSPSGTEADTIRRN